MSLSKTIYRNVSKFLSRKNIRIVRSLQFYTHRLPLKNNFNLDYIRSSTLELVAHEINEKGLKGNVAELGVFKGEFAAKLNELFPQRKLYLFDTFEGFDSRDTKKEKEKEFSTGMQNFSETSVELVLSKMTNKNNCIVKKGFFPETAAGIDDTFVFVSLDADLYDPILAGLNFFYPRLIPGGYIFIHDYNNLEYKGARQAVKDYCKTNNLTIVPLPDICGTAILTK